MLARASPEGRDLTSDRSIDPERSLQRLLLSGSATYRFVTSALTVIVSASVFGYLLAPLARTAPWFGACVGLAGSALLVTPLAIGTVQRVSRLSRDGVVVEGTHDGWGNALPGWLAVLGPEIRLQCPRYRYDYAGDSHHTLWIRYLPREAAHMRVRVLVDPQRPRSALVLGGVGTERIPEDGVAVSRPHLSRHLVPWVKSLGTTTNGCGCSVVLFVLALSFLSASVSGNYEQSRSLTASPLFWPVVVIGLAAPFVAVLYALARVAARTFSRR